MLTSIYNIDITLTTAFNHLPHNAVLDFLAQLVHILTFGGWIYFAVLTLLWLSKKPLNRRLAKLGLLTGAGIYIITDLVLKNVVQRSRPFQVLCDIAYIAPGPSSYSFPSGQAAIAFMVATLYWCVFPKRLSSVLALLCAVLIAVNRMYMGHHYFSDVAAGGALGILCALIVYYGYRTVIQKNIRITG